ncbi:MAG: DUF5681 domain-containing protein [Gammaproteobacteria bacterium]
MPFKKGQSGNPKGRKPGLSNQAKFRGLIEAHIPSLVDTVVKKALAGDMTAMKICIDRVCPPLKARDELIKINKMGSQQLLDQANTVLLEMHSGKISPTEAGSIMRVLESKTKILEIVDLTARIEELENFANNGNKP